MSSDELTTIAQKAARGGFFLFIGNTSSTVILAVGIIIVARLLGPSSYGLYTLTLVIPTLLVSLSDAGMNFGLVRLPARLGAEGNYGPTSDTNSDVTITPADLSILQIGPSTPAAPTSAQLMPT